MADPLPQLERLTANADPKSLIPVIKDTFRYIWDRTQQLQRLVKTPNQGTLSPDQKPKNLGVTATGTKFFSTDFGREFTWNGRAWEDSLSSPPRFQISFFFSTPEPASGWAICNGAATAISTSSGSTLHFVTPNLPAYSGMAAWIRL